MSNIVSIDRAYSWAIQTCNASNVGYSQKYRNRQTVGGVTYYDCSSFINYALLAGGWETPNYAPNRSAFTTATMGSALASLGFTEIHPNSELKAGDIGWRPGHTEMCYIGGFGKGIFMGAHTDNLPLADQVSISKIESSWVKIYRYGSGGAIGVGYSIYVVCALCGNAWRESYINPGINEFTGGGFGLFQWTGGRRENLEKWLTDNGYAVNSAQGQLEYLIVEDDWQGEFHGISSLQEFLKSDSTDIAMLTEAFMICWERPGVPALADRIGYALKCYYYILENAQSTEINKWIVSNTALSESESLNNAVMMYRYLTGGGGGGGHPTKPGLSNKIYMSIRYH